jgi:hypothetical protein
VSDLILIGIDAGKTSHHAAAVGGDGRLIWSQRVANDQAAIEELIDRGRRSGAELLWAVDLTSAAAALLLALLLAAGQRVAYVPAARSTGWRTRSPARARPTRRTPGSSRRPPGCTAALLNCPLRTSWSSSCLGWSPIARI